MNNGLFKHPIFFFSALMLVTSAFDFKSALARGLEKVPGVTTRNRDHGLKFEKSGKMNHGGGLGS